MGSTPVIDHAVPNLPPRDFDGTEAFSGGFGFERVFRDEGWMILSIAKPVATTTDVAVVEASR
jgi:hypothetical protein